MAPRAYWKGSLKLSLVTCPIALYPASTQAERTHFHQINTKTGHRGMSVNPAAQRCEARLPDVHGRLKACTAPFAQSAKLRTQA
jgi:non-homologous end joining protein Ku